MGKLTSLFSNLVNKFRDCFGCCVAESVFPLSPSFGVVWGKFSSLSDDDSFSDSDDEKYPGDNNEFLFIFHTRARIRPNTHTTHTHTQSVSLSTAHFPENCGKLATICIRILSKSQPHNVWPNNLFSKYIYLQMFTNQFLHSCRYTKCICDRHQYLAFFFFFSTLCNPDVEVQRVREKKIIRCIYAKSNRSIPNKLTDKHCECCLLFIANSAYVWHINVWYNWQNYAIDYGGLWQLLRRTNEILPELSDEAAQCAVHCCIYLCDWAMLLFFCC